MNIEINRSAYFKKQKNTIVSITRKHNKHINLENAFKHTLQTTCVDTCGDERLGFFK